MKKVRLIGRLDIKGPNLIKGVHLEGLRVLGKPEEYAEQYYKDGCDELIVHDVAAQLLNKLVSLDSIKKISTCNPGFWFKRQKMVRDFIIIGIFRPIARQPSIHF